LTNNKNFRIVI